MDSLELITDIKKYVDERILKLEEKHKKTEDMSAKISAGGKLKAFKEIQNYIETRK